MFKLKPYQQINVFIRRFFPGDHSVDFVIGGTQKGGTSALYDLLNQHPEIGFADRKEIHYFDNDRYFAKKLTGRPNIYHSFFSRSVTNKILGDATPIYMYWQDVPERIHDYHPGMKWILILRNPISRAYSHWNMEFQKGNDHLSFDDAISQETDRLSQYPNHQHPVYSYFDRGLYSQQIERIWQYFPEESTLILKSEWLRSNPDNMFKKICDFLQLPVPEVIGAREIHNRKYNSRLSPAMHELLRKRYSREIKNLERLLDWDCSDWLTPIENGKSYES